MADSAVEGLAQQAELDPPCQASRNRQACGSPPRVEAQSDWERKGEEVAQDNRENDSKDSESERRSGVLEGIERGGVQPA